MSHEYPLIRERKVLSFCATNPTQTLQGHSRVSSSTGRGRHCCPKLRVKVQPCRGHSNRQGGRTAVQTPDTGEIGRGCCPALENHSCSYQVHFTSTRTAPTEILSKVHHKRSHYFSLVKITRNLIFAVTV